MILEPFDKIVSLISESLNKPEDQMRMMLIIFLAFPIGYAYRFIGGKNKRHTYSILLGAFLHVFMFRWEVFHFWGLALAVYIIMATFSRKNQAWVVFFVAMTHLSGMHIKRVLFDYGGWSMDATTFLMPLVSRISSLGFVYADGAKAQKDKSETSKESGNIELSDEQKSRMVVKKPTLVEILSYVSFPAANICGPFFEFRDYIDFIEEKNRYKNIPNSNRQTLNKFLMGILFLSTYVILPQFFDANSINTKEYFAKPYCQQYIYFYIALFGLRATYYSVWYFNEGAMTWAGLSYNGTGEKGEPKFDRIKCVDAIAVET